MEQEVARWLHTQLGYDAAADTSLSANCRGNLKGLWEFLIANYKTPEAKRHIQHVLARHRREQQAAREAPQRQREAAARRARLAALRKRAAELEVALTGLHSRVEGHAQEVVEQASDRMLLQHDLQEQQSQALLLQAFVGSSRQLLPRLQAKLAALQAALAVAQARCQAPGSHAGLQAVQQQLAQLSSSIMLALEKAADDRVMSAGSTLHDLQPAAAAAGGDQHQQRDQHQDAPAAAGSSASGGASSLQQTLSRCKLISGFKLGDDVRAAVVQLLQEPPAVLWSCAAALATDTLQHVTALLDEAEGEMMAPLAWPLAGGQASDARSADGGDRQQLPDQQQQQLPLAAAAGSKHRLPWASGPSALIAAAYEQQGIAPPPEIRVRMRQMQHVQLFVAAREADARRRAASRELHVALGSTPLLGAVAAGGANAGGWEAQLAQLHIRVAGLLGQLEVLRRHEAEHQAEAGMLQEAEEAYADKLAKVGEKVLADEQLNQVLAHLSHDAFELFRAVTLQRAAAGQLVDQLLAPCSSAAAAGAAAAVDRLASEAGAVARLPVLRLTAPEAVAAHGAASAHAASSSSNPVLLRPTVGRLQLAAQQLLIAGRVTTGGKAAAAAAAAAAAVAAGGRDATADTAAGLGALSAVLDGHGGSAAASSSRADAAAVNALRGAAALDVAAAARCPAALLLAVAGRHGEAQHLQQQVAALSSAHASAAASSSQAAEAGAELQAKVAVLWDAQRDTVLPQLHALLEQCVSARAFARHDLLADLTHLWEMPAMHLLPERTYDGKNCSQWFEEVQVLHAQRRQLGGSRHAA